MYMANAKVLCLVPNATYIPLTSVEVLRWANANFKIRVGSKANLSVFKYQHVGIGNAKLSRWGCNPTQAPNASGLASQWNIGLRIMSDIRNSYIELGLVSNRKASQQKCS